MADGWEYVDAEEALHEALDTSSEDFYDEDGGVSWLDVTACVLAVLVERGLVLSPPAALTGLVLPVLK